MDNIHLPTLHTRNMLVNWTPAGVVRAHMDHYAEDDVDAAGREQMREQLMHHAQVIERASEDYATDLVRNASGYGPVFSGPAQPDRLEVVRVALVRLLERAAMDSDERTCAEDLLRLCVRYQVRLGILRRAMAQADNPHEPTDWMREEP
jgi:hypothetical protein